MDIFSEKNHTVCYLGHKKQRRISVAFIVRKIKAKTELEYNAVSDKIMSVTLYGCPFNMTVS